MPLGKFKKIDTKLAKPVYKVEGRMGYYFEYSYNEPEVWHGTNLSKTFSADSDEAALLDARKLIEAFAKEHDEFRPERHMGDGEAPVFEFSLSKVLLEIAWNGGSDGRPAVAAKEPVAPHLSEKVRV